MNEEIYLERISYAFLMFFSCIVSMHFLCFFHVLQQIKWYSQSYSLRIGIRRRLGQDLSQTLGL
jgi:hypothetical protein